MLNIIKSIIFGIVEGITEWLPISSTGHLYLFQSFMNLNEPKSFISMYMVVIQLGAILAVVLLYWKRLWPIRRIRTTKDRVGKIGWDHNILKMWLKVIVATIPAAVIGGPFDDFFEAHFYNPTSIAVMLILFGILFIVVENHNATKKARVYSVRFHLQGRDHHRDLPVNRGPLPRHVPLRRDDHRGADDRDLPHLSRGIHVLPGDPGDVRRLAPKAAPLPPFHRRSGRCPRRRHDRFLRRLGVGHQIPDAVHQNPRFQGLRLVPNRPRDYRARRGIPRLIFIIKHTINGPKGPFFIGR